METVSESPESGGASKPAAEECPLPAAGHPADKTRPEKITVEKSDFRLGDVFGGIERVFGSKAKGLHLRFLVDIDPALPATVTGDAPQLGIILSALIGNAIGCTAKGFVELKVRQVRRTETTVTAEFKVTDTGTGMAEGKLAVLFDTAPANRAEAVTRPLAHAHLTLPAVRQLVDLQGGMIHAKSKPGMGSTFTVLLSFEMPAAVPVNIPTRKAAGNPTPQPLADARVLLVEDNRMNQLVVRKFLEKWGVRVDIVENGIEAIEKLRLHPFDLILMDLQMPGMDGYKTARHIRYKMEAPAKNIPIVALTASDMPDVGRKVRESGMDDLIIKPFDPRDLHLKILKFTNRSTVPDRNEPIIVSEASIRAGHVNLQYLEEISANNKEFVNDMLRLFIRQMPQFVRKLRTECETTDWQAVRYSLHKMKSSLATVGIFELEPVIRQLELYAIQETNAAETIRLVAHLEQTCEKVYNELREKLAGAI